VLLRAASCELCAARLMMEMMEMMVVVVMMRE
jgi:hypothetical protein